MENLITTRNPRTTTRTRIRTTFVAIGDPLPGPKIVLDIRMSETLIFLRSRIEPDVLIHNFRIHFVLTCLFLIQLFHTSPYLLHHPHSHHPSLCHSFIPHSRHSSFTNPSLHRSHLSYRTDLTDTDYFTVSRALRSISF